MYANRHEPEQVRALADYYWRILLSVAAIVVLFSVGYGVFVFLSVLQDEGGTGTDIGVAVQMPSMISRAQLQDTLDEFEARQQLFESLKTNVLDVAEPSR